MPGQRHFRKYRPTDERLVLNTLIGPTGFQTDGGRVNGVSLNYAGLAVSSGDIIRMRVERIGGDDFGGLAGVEFAVVPEPASLVLLLSRVTAWCCRRRR